MNFSRPYRVYNCDGRVFWIGEDENSSVVAVGPSACRIDLGSRIASPLYYEGEPVHAFIDGSLITICQTAEGSVVRFPNGVSVELSPGAHEVMDSVYVPVLKSAFILTATSILKLDIDGSARLLARNDLDGEPAERIIANEKSVVAFRYGLLIHTIDGKCRLFGTRSYSQVGFLSSGHLIAADLEGAIDSFNSSGAPLGRIGQVQGEVLYLVDHKGSPSIIFKRGGIVHCGVLSEYGLQSIEIGAFNCECFQYIEDTGVIVISTLEGELFVWDISGQSVSTALSDHEWRVVALLWSTARGELIAGSRRGDVFVLTAVSG